MKNQIPTYFDNSPLLEVVFEVRFKPEHSFASKALGPFLQNALTSQTLEAPPFEPMDGLHIPKEIKEQDINLYCIPSYKVIMGDYSIAISDGSIAISQNRTYLPYQGWKTFHKYIANTMETISKLVELSTIERCSLKYSDFIEKKDDIKPLSFLQFQANLGETDLSKVQFDLHIDEKVTDDINIVTRLCPSVTIQVNENLFIPKHHQNEEKLKLSGMLFSTDCICFFDRSCLNNTNDIKNLFFSRLEELHEISRQKFVSSFSSRAFEYLGANYD